MIQANGDARGSQIENKAASYSELLPFDRDDNGVMFAQVSQQERMIATVGDESGSSSLLYAAHEMVGVSMDLGD